MFNNLSNDCHPIAAPSRKYSFTDRKFIDAEIKQLLKEGIIEPSTSPWRAQLVISQPLNHKKRMCVDYAQTINRFTYLDAYPLPKIEDHVNELSKYRVFSTLDLSSAYHQIDLLPEDRPYTAFEANGITERGLFQFTRIPYGVTNGVPVFQRKMDNFIEEYGLKDTKAFMDNIDVAGMDDKEHDFNLKKLYEAGEKAGLTFNLSKSVIKVPVLPSLGYVVSHGSIRPDPERFRPLLELPVPANDKARQRAVGFFAYYSKFIPSYSEKVKPLTQAHSFPLGTDAINAFNKLTT